MVSIPKPAASYARYVGPGRLISPDMTAAQALKALKEAGFERIGAGMSQTAFAKRGGGKRVVKLSAGFDVGGWDAANMFAANPDIPDFPRVYGLTKMRRGVWAVEMERLQSSEETDQYMEEVSDEVADGALEKIERIWGPAVANAMRAIGWEEYIDLHDTNYMWRGRTPVVVDPFNNFRGSYSHSKDTREAIRMIRQAA